MDMVLYERPLRIELAGSALLVGGEQHPKSVRTLAQMERTFMSREPGDASQEMYYMYRSVFRKGDVRFDITVIPALTVKGECSKTHGHYHPSSEEGPEYPEVYQVLRGSAVFILQKKNRNGSVDAMIVDAGEGDAVLLPPGWGHVTVNRGKGTLVLSNLVYDRFESLYEEYDENQGAAFYYLEGGQLEHNTNYIVQKIEHLPADQLNQRYGFSCKDLLSEFQADPGRFGFLAKPGLLFKS
jgi:glucose-6-phosphate isomerase